jgi:hypothetical protein
LCEIKKPRERGGHSPRWAAEPEKLIIIIIIIKVKFSPEQAMKAQRGSIGIALPFL